MKPDERWIWFCEGCGKYFALDKLADSGRAVTEAEKGIFFDRAVAKDHSTCSPVPEELNNAKP